jgi:hypothetical protein
MAIDVPVGAGRSGGMPGVKDRFDLCSQPAQHHRLGHPVRDRRHTNVFSSHRHAAWGSPPPAPEAENRTQRHPITVGCCVQRRTPANPGEQRVRDGPAEVGSPLEQCTVLCTFPARRRPELVHDGDNVVNQIVYSDRLLNGELLRKPPNAPTRTKALSGNPTTP